MKKLLLTLAFILGLCQVGYGAISVTKYGSNDQAGGTDCVVTWSGGGSSTAGDAIVVFIYDTNQFTRTFTVTDSASNTYALDASYTGLGSGNWRFYVYSSPNTTAASSVTVTASGYEQFGVCALSASEIATSSAFDVANTIYDNGFTTTSGNWTTNGSGSLAQANELVIVPQYDLYTGSTAYSVSTSGFTDLDLEANNIYGNLCYKVVSSTSSIVVSGTYTTSSNTRVYTPIITYKGSDAGGGGGTPASTAGGSNYQNVSLQNVSLQ